MGKEPKLLSSRLNVSATMSVVSNSAMTVSRAIDFKPEPFPGDGNESETENVFIVH